MASFAQLPREVRDIIWPEAAAVQFKQVSTAIIAGGFPCLCEDDGAECLRQAFVGHNDLTSGREKEPLRLYVHDYEGKLHLGVNEFQILLNCLPVANACSEARAHAAAYCSNQIKVIDLVYTKDPPNVENEILERVNLRPTTVMVTIPYQEKNEPSRFSSAYHFVEVVDRIFGDCVEHLLLNFSVDEHRTYEDIYWPHVGKTRSLHKAAPIIIDDPNHEKWMVFMTPERGMHMMKHLRPSRTFNLWDVAHHLLKFFEILDACKQKKKLLQLREIELKIYTYSRRGVFTTSFKAVIKDGSLWVDVKPVMIGSEHEFSELN